MKLSKKRLRLIRSALRMYAAEVESAASWQHPAKRAKWNKLRNQALRLVDEITIHLQDKA